MDVLPNMLNLLAPRRVVPARIELSGAFRLVAQPFRHLHFATVLSGYAIVEGFGWPSPMLLHRDDVMVVTTGRSYSMRSDEPAAEVNGTELVMRARLNDGIARLGRGQPDTILLGGRLTCESADAAMVLDALPPAIHLRGDTAGAASLRGIIELLAGELASHAPGERLIVERLADILLLQVLRAHPAMREGPVRELHNPAADRRMIRAMLMMHGQPGRAWTVENLAVSCGMSRSTFAERFHNTVGASPAEYLTRSRMNRIHQALAETTTPFKAIAFDNGYLSRGACSKAFKRTFGVSPRDIRAGL